jgi:itaconate CoA-transferase
MPGTADPRPLDGITVISVEQAVAAPFATRQLADLGARVIKVERPGEGDFARRYDETVLGQSSYFVWLNRSKESLTLNLKSAVGRELLHALLAQADVFVQNLAPGAAGRLGLDADTLSARYPRLIVCQISGYGDDGPWADRKSYDLLVQAETGLVSLTGTEEAMARVGVSVADIAAGGYAFSGILTALYTRATTGRSPAVSVSLFEALAEWLGAPAYYTRYGGSQPPRSGARHATIAPYGLFETADGVILLAIQNHREWVSFCTTVLDDAALATEERFATNSARVAHRDEAEEVIGRRLATVDTNRALELLDRAGIANARLNSVAQFLEHPVLAGRGRWSTVDTPGGPIQALRPPADLRGVAPRMDPVPAVGAHTEAILRSLGRDADAIRALRADGVI